MTNHKSIEIYSKTEVYHGKLNIFIKSTLVQKSNLLLSNYFNNLALAYILIYMPMSWDRFENKYRYSLIDNDIRSKIDRL